MILNSIVEKIKYKINLDLEKLCLILMVFLMFCGLFTLKKGNAILTAIGKKSNVTGLSKTLDEENLETYNKRLLLDVSEKIKEINQSLNTIETLVTQENINDVKNEVHNLGEIQKQFVELLSLEEVKEEVKQ